MHGGGDAFVATLGARQTADAHQNAVVVGVAAITAVDLTHAATITCASVNNGSTVV
jgi:hypothetical protein